MPADDLPEVAQTGGGATGASTAKLRLTRRIGHGRLAALLVLTLTVITVLVSVGIIRSAQGRRDGIAERFDARHTTASRFIEAYLEQALEQQGFLAASTLAGPISQVRFDQITQENQFSSTALLDRRGRALVVSPAGSTALGDGAAAGATTTAGLSDPAIRSAVNNIPAVAALKVIGNLSPLVEFAVPFGTPTGRRIFVGGYPVGDTALKPFVASALVAYHSAHVYLVDADGIVITADGQQAVGYPLSRTSAPLVRALDRDRNGHFGRGAHEQHYLAGPIAGTNWQLVFALDADELFQPITAAQKWAPWAGLIGFALMGLIIIALFTRALAGQAQAEDDHARQHAILDTTSDAFIGMDDRGLVVDWNTAAARLLGWTEPEALGRSVAELMVPPDNREAHTTGLRSFLDTGVARIPLHPINLTAQHRDGHQFPVELTVSRTHWKGTWRFHAFLRDITVRLEHEAQLHEMALTDPLTGLANRRAFLDNLEQAHARARRHGSELAVLYADVDHFKAINDTYGHAAGDAILLQIAERLREHFRTEDTIGRLGGDEFAIICEDFTAFADLLVERLSTVLARPYGFRDQTIPASVSIGLASPQPDESTEHLLERADRIMYLAKATNHA
jgi:diguanylate cyclase (GGDEF)-like protein/PAS domain S-box-containing protein